MAIYRLLQNSPLGPEEIAVLTDAYERTLRAVGLVDRSNPVTELIAKKVIELAQRGVREAQQLAALAVEELGAPIGPYSGTTPDDYLARAEHYRKAADGMGVDSFTRYHLQAMERSYRTLAESEAALRDYSVKRTEALRKLESKDD